MIRYFLTRIQIEGFRGINNENDPLDIRFKKDGVNSVFAVNALGKSSIFEALCYSIKGSIPKLVGLPAVEKAEEYYCNRFHTTGTATILLTLTPDDGTNDVVIRIQRSATGTRTVDSPSGYPKPELLLESLNDELGLLDHDTFFRFIDDAPLKRGRTFSGLLGLQKLSEFRQVLQILSHRGNLDSDFELRSLEMHRDAEGQKEAEALRSIRLAYKHIVGVDPPDPIDDNAVVENTSKALAQVSLLKPFFETADLTTVNFKEIRTAVKEAEASDKRERLSLLIRSITKLNKLAASANESIEQFKLKQLFKDRDEALRQTRGNLFFQLYEVLHQIYESKQWDDPFSCPGCESKLELSFPDTLVTRLSQYEQVSKFKADIPKLWGSANWVSRIRALEELDAVGIDYAERRFSQLDGVFRHQDPKEEDVDTAVGALEKLEESRKAKLIELSTEKERLEKEMPPSLVTLTEQVEYAEQLQQAIVEHRQCCKAKRAMEDKLIRRQNWAQFIEKGSRLFSEAEVALSTSQTSMIETQYRQMYGKITSNPEIVPGLKKSTGSEDLHLRLEKFYGLHDLSATTLLPESYRNALAISIFLSTASNTKTPARFMVLDDITSSFDAGHQYNLMELLHTQVAYPFNQNGRQVILLSHDGLLEKYFDTISNTVQWFHQRLQGSPPKGSVFSQHQDANRLRVNAEKFLKVGQVEQAGPLMRQYLEYCLLQVIRKVNIPVLIDFSIRDDRKMVANCLDAIKAAMDLHEKAGTLVLDSQQVTNIKTVHLQALISNWVVHYPTGITSSLSPYVLLGVLDAVDRFLECFKYSCSCFGSPTLRFYKNLAQKHCSC